MEFLVEIEVLVPPLMEKSDRDRLIEAERVRGRELTAEGIIRAIWRIPGRFARFGVYPGASRTAQSGPARTRRSCTKQFRVFPCGHSRMCG